jgi:hypothetical protein
MAGSLELPYQVHYSEAVRTTLRQLGTRTQQVQLGNQFVSVLRDLDARLRAAPLAVGEAAYQLQVLGLHVRFAGTPFFYLRFGVDEARLFVYVIDCVASARLF